MTIGLVPPDRAALARRLKQLEIPDWSEFVQTWMGFNAVYGVVEGRTERNRLMNAVRAFISSAEARRLLQQSEDAIRFFAELPPGNMWKSPNHPGFRQRSAADLAVVNDGKADARERLAHLMSVVYQIRCNLVHGSKDPHNLRDRRLVSASHGVLAPVLEAILPQLDASAELRR